MSAAPFTPRVHAISQENRIPPCLEARPQVSRFSSGKRARFHIVAISFLNPGIPFRIRAQTMGYHYSWMRLAVQSFLPENWAKPPEFGQSSPDPPLPAHHMPRARTDAHPAVHAPIDNGANLEPTVSPARATRPRPETSVLGIRPGRAHPRRPSSVLVAPVHGVRPRRPSTTQVHDTHPWGQTRSRIRYFFRSFIILTHGHHHSARPSPPTGRQDTAWLDWPDDPRYPCPFATTNRPRPTRLSAAGLSGVT